MLLRQHSHVKQLSDMPLCSNWELAAWPLLYNDKLSLGIEFAIFVAPLTLLVYGLVTAVDSWNLAKYLSVSCFLHAWIGWQLYSIRHILTTSSNC